MSKRLNWIAGIIGFYIVFVLVFETVYLGYLQPSFEDGGIPMLDIVTTDDSGREHMRRLAQLESSSGPMYVSAHHWTRGWYYELVTRPRVRVEVDGNSAEYVAVVVQGDEFDRIAAEFPIPFFMRFLMGFPPGRDIVRLDPAQGRTESSSTRELSSFASRA